MELRRLTLYVCDYLVVAFEAADHAGDLVNQAKVMN